MAPTPHPVYFQLAMSPAISTSTSKKHLSKHKPLLRLELRDLSHDGTKTFLDHLDATSVLDEAISGVLDWLYSPHSIIPPVRSITLVLRPMGGVAYTTGLDLDPDHKEIHFSLDYIKSIKKERRRDEMLGVIRHEMVHCWQWNALGTAPGGLIEGIADYVRLRSGFVPPHWKQTAEGHWDAGYQHTGYFLDWLDQNHGEGSVIAINEALRTKEYCEEKLWDELFGKPVDKLWKEYRHALDKNHGDKGKDDEDECSKTQETEKQDPTISVGA
ncbi:peptidase of plants and bacteria-domain-containing protein [Phyllosticta capitalensis]|uniref:Peptidase of plants and bacteria-domain-containing protein n=2 Tax=Phyllosticta capitalensis TaxID=121624 RepID=A0ABR1YAC5_9PEZI